MKATNLFGTPITKRPTAAHPAVISRAATILADRLIRSRINVVVSWEADDPSTNHRRYREDLCAVLGSGESLDGYNLCRALEDDYGWSPSAALAEALDGGAIFEAVDAAVEEWIITEGIQPGLAVGAAVTVTIRAHTGTTIESKPYQGVIRKIDMESGSYHVHVPELDPNTPSHRYCFPFEQLDPPEAP